MKRNSETARSALMQAENLCAMRNASLSAASAITCRTQVTPIDVDRAGREALSLSQKGFCVQWR